MKKNERNDKECGIFCEFFGSTPRNKILEHFLAMRSLDFSIGDVARETGLNRATAYNTIEELIKAKYIIPTRKISGAQLYKLNNDKKEVKVLIEMFDLMIEKVVNEHKQKSELVEV